MSWETGSARIHELITAGEIEQVEPSSEMAHRLLTDARRHLVSAALARDSGDLTGGFQLAYDALRKSAASLLAVQGLRATSRGGHIAIQEAVNVQFGTVIKPFKSFSRIRRARNSFEYPTASTTGPDLPELVEALEKAKAVHDAAEKLLEIGVLEPWR